MASPDIPRARRRLAPESLALLTAIAAVLVVAGSVSGVFSSRLPMAGDMAAHNWWLLEFRDRLLGHHDHEPLSVFSWTNSSNAGMPFGFFYFPFPALLVSLMSTVVPDALAIKLMLATAYVLPVVGVSRFMRALSQDSHVQLAAPAAGFMAAVISVPYVFGGNMVATVTGEYAFAIALGAGLLALAELLRIAAGSTTAFSAVWWRATLFFGVGVLSHLQVAFMIAVWAFVLLAFRCRSVPALLRATSVAVASVLISAWWWLPAVLLSQEALGNQRLEEHDILGIAFHHAALTLLVAAVVGSAVALRRYRADVALLIAFAVSGLLLVRLMPDSLWGHRAFPMFWFALGMLSTYTLALGGALFNKSKRRGAAPWLGVLTALLAVLAIDAASPNSNSSLKKLSTFAQVQRGTAGLPGDASLHELLTGLNALSPGRALLAFDQGSSKAFGTDDLSGTIVRATSDRIQVLTGLFPEAAPTSIAAFSATNAVSSMPHSLSPLDPVLDLGNIARAPRLMEALAVRYVITADRNSIAALANNPSFREVFRTAPSIDPELPLQWGVFELTDQTYAGVVRPLSADPFLSPIGELIQDLPGSDSFAGKTREWVKALVESPTEVTPAAIKGPASWRNPALRKPFNVSHVRVSDDLISFDVDRVGSPVQIAVTWSSMWRANGATGPYQVTPGFMVVVPTASHITLTRDTPASVPLGAWVSGLALLGLTAASLLRRRSGRV